MYVGKIMGKTIRLTNRDYEALKKKWHPDNVKSSETRKSCSAVKGNCSLCKYYSGCKNCPLDNFREEDDYYGCISILNHVFNGQFSKMLVYWDSDFGVVFHGDISTNKKRMEKIQAVLNTFKKVSA